MQNYRHAKASRMVAGMTQELFDIGNGLAVCCNPEGKFHGWLFAIHSDGQYVSVKKLELVENPFGPLTDVFIHISPKSNTCDHDFKGWRAFADGNGGEQVCTKCGMGAMAHSLKMGT